jgi:hypothetical protein
MVTTEVGHHEKRVYLSLDGQLVVPSSGAIKIEAGGLLCEKPSTGGYSAMCATGVSNALSNRGISIIKTTDVVGVDTLAQPTPATVGCVKTVIWDTTAVRKLRLATVAGARDVRCGSSSCSVIIKTSDAGKMGHKAIPIYGASLIQLMALSTDKWAVVNLQPSATGVKYWIFSSCT